ncbi:histone-lysine N-methyltransferase TRX1 [Selaginella moellendorffii]|uniref:histone-lysine N-methyltransferase TRX1 n=1 Tax=Selaginella moellendorffii TaxID=88036 RepID=UPI000D1CE5C4|nr:histone-lysine N-methyltransferase TRX1 [Selaginella moellendorffii]|eukprot:XP_024535681.1 histone-lysine N-methyltransferase TRX1 [Selaginella moellendorffii]
MVAHPTSFQDDSSSKPVKFKSVSQFYTSYQAEPAVDELDDPSTEEQELDDSSTDNHESDYVSQESDDVSQEWSDSEDTARRPVKKRRMSIIQSSFHAPAKGKEEQPAFRTLAQLLEPRRNERIKSFPPKRRKSSISRDIAATKLKRFYCKPRTNRAKGRTLLEGNIGLIVDLVFQSVDDGNSSNHPRKDEPLPSLPTEESIGNCGVPVKLADAEDSVTQEVSTSFASMEDEQKLVTVRDPEFLTIGRLFARGSAKSSDPSFHAQLKWREIDVGGTDPLVLVNHKCKVYNPLERKWLAASVVQYDQLSKKHQVHYDIQGEVWQFLSRERIAFYISLDEKMRLITSYDERSSLEERKAKAEELLVFAASTESYDRLFQHGDIVWAETPGYPMWPAFVMDDQHARLCNLEISTGELPVHYFGTYESARIIIGRIVKFSKGILDDYHLKCSRISFDRGLEEVDRYYREQKLPPGMTYLQEEVVTTLTQAIHSDSEEKSEKDEDFVGDERKHKVRKSLESISKCPIKLGSLQVLNLGKIVKDSEYFHDQHYIWTEGYTSIRKFFSIKDPTKTVIYKMEILRNPNARTMPLFRVTPDDGEQVEGPSAAACWKKILNQLHRARKKLNLNGQHDKKRQFYRSGAAMFGLSNPQISRLIQALPYARVCSKFKVWREATTFEDLDAILPAGFKHVEVEWKHLDHCSVCDTNEEYEGNILLQCDKCRMLVHLNCYGVLEPPGDSWLCNLCDSNAPKRSPPCCLCPIKGGAMKRTTDGRWVHLACALWIPETSCVDMDRMEPIEGISSVNKERWKLTCTICSVPYGACIQCADHHCRVSYHALCARAAGFCTKVLEGLRRKRNRTTGVQEVERSVQLVSYCKKHMHSKMSTKATFDTFATHEDDYAYASHNPSGSARSEPYNVAIRRGRREPDHYSAALAKRAFLVNRPHIVTGCLRNPYKRVKRPAPVPIGVSKVQPFLTIRPRSAPDGRQVALTVSERFYQMRASLHRRLTFGKSAIHGWGLFAKEPHGAGDMVIEYAGEIIRPTVADVREKRCYNSLVGAGTYMFCIDNERVVDATRAGSIAHLINHSCEPNCYSRVVTTNGKERIVIFAKQDIAGGDEVTYDYRFTSIGDQLPCHCGTAGCRGIVNVMDEEDESGRILVRTAELTKLQ